MHLTAEQLEFRDTLRTFVRDEVKPAAISPKRLEPFAKPLLMEQLNTASAMGLRALMLSDANGGAGADNLSACIVAEALGQGDADIAVVMAHTATLARVLLADLMTAQQRSGYLPAFNKDNAFHLAYAGCDPRAGLQANYHQVRSSASACASATKNAKGDWLVQGEFAAVANACVAQLIAIEAQSTDGPVTLLVSSGSAGLTVQEPSNTRGGTTLRWGHGAPGKVTLKDCVVPAADSVHGSWYSNYAQRVALQEAAANIGVGQAAYEAAIDYTRLRRQGGKKTIEHQAIGILLADIAIKLEAARNMVWKAAWLLDYPQAVADRSASALPLDLMACAYVNEAMVSVTERAAECFGAMGVMRYMPLQKYVDDALMFKHGVIGPTAAKLLVAEGLAGFEREKA